MFSGRNTKAIGGTGLGENKKNVPNRKQEDSAATEVIEEDGCNTVAENKSHREEKGQKGNNR